MARMIELVRQSAVPASVMRSAARGALSLPPSEVLEILVYLAHHPVFGEQARSTLAGWDETACAAALASPETPQEVLEYFAAPQNVRPRLLPALLENPALHETRMVELARQNSIELVRMLLDSLRVWGSRKVLDALAANPHLTQEHRLKVDALLKPFRDGSAEALEPAPAPAPATPAEPAGDADDILQLELDKFLKEHAAEIQAAEKAPFALVGFTTEEQAEAEAPPGAGPAAAAKHPAAGEERERISVLQKIARLSVGERVQLAMKGSRDDRFILIRDGSKVVSSAVLESPKLTDNEVESFAAMKNVQESVLRGIASKRKFMKNYAVARVLTANPRCPLDVSLTLLKGLLPSDLKNLSMNKNVSDTLRKMAYKLFKEKATAK
jgi:hypothetical protein